MKRLILRTCVCLIGIAATRESHAQSSFAGVLLATNGSGIVAGAVVLTVNGGQVSFQATLFEAWVSNTTLAPSLEVQGTRIPFDFGSGTTGSWPVNQFTGPLPGQIVAPAPNQQFPNLEQMPGPQPLSAGARFAGSFTAFPELEDALLTSSGKVLLHVNGIADGMENPLAVEMLVTTSPRISNQFAVNLNGTNEIRSHESPYHGNGAFTLNGNLLIYDLAIDAGFQPARAGIFGPASLHLSNLRSYIDADSAMVIYRGQINLTDRAVEALRRGELYVNVFTTRHTRGQLLGSILPVPVPGPPGNQPVFTVAPK